MELYGSESLICSTKLLMLITIKKGKIWIKETTKKQMITRKV